jgi:hypothetical protein
MALLHGRAGRLTVQNGWFWRGLGESKATHAANKAALVKAIGAVSDTSAPLVADATARPANSGGPRGPTGPLGTPSIRLTAARAACLARCGAACLSCSSSLSACPRPRAGTRHASRSPDPAPFVGLGRDAGDEAVWTAVWHWLRGERPVERPGPGRPGAFRRPQRFPI